MTTLVKTDNVIKKTYNIKADLVRVMKELIPTRKQTDFVNHAIEQSITQIQNVKLKEEAMNALHLLRKVRKNNKSNKTAVEVVAELRASSTNS